MGTRLLFKALSGFSLMMAGTMALAEPGDPSAPAVSIESGRLDGVTLDSGIRAYLGIPYAAPPVRELRWREPRAVEPWHGIYHADRFGPQCFQPGRNPMANQYSGAEVSSENCLYLNVWTKPGLEKAPVIVYIHGGAFFIGTGNMPLYGGEEVAKKGAVFVNLNYRLGALGFLAHPELTEESPTGASGNYAFLDQIAALTWIQKNIDKFGGDPNNVTIVGQSAGGAAVLALQASPLTRGLFHRAVAMSGGGVNVDGPMGSSGLDSAEAEGLKFQEMVGAKSVADMRHLPVDRLVVPRAPGAPRIGPVVDGYVLPASTDDIFARSQQNDVPLVVGFTRDEGMGGGASQKGWAQAQATRGKAPVYGYEFIRPHTYAPGVTFSDLDPATAGAYHTSEVPFWLGTIDSFNLFRKTRAWTSDDRGFSSDLTDSLVAFARTGNPSTAKLSWTKFDPANPSLIELGGPTARTIPWPQPAGAGNGAPPGSRPGTVRD